MMKYMYLYVISLLLQLCNEFQWGMLMWKVVFVLLYIILYYHISTNYLFIFAEHWIADQNYKNHFLFPRNKKIILLNKLYPLISFTGGCSAQSQRLTPDLEAIRRIHGSAFNCFNRP